MKPPAATVRDEPAVFEHDAGKALHQGMSCRSHVYVSRLLAAQMGVRRRDFVDVAVHAASGARQTNSAQFSSGWAKLSQLQPQTPTASCGIISIDLPIGGRPVSENENSGVPKNESTSLGKLTPPQSMFREGHNHGLSNGWQSQRPQSTTPRSRDAALRASKRMIL